MVILSKYSKYLLISVDASLADIYCLDAFDDVRSTRSSFALRLRKAISQNCVSLLPDRIALTDAFGFSDWELDSALGVENGKVYDELWNRAQKNPLHDLDMEELHKVSILASACALN